MHFIWLSWTMWLGREVCPSRPIRFLAHVSFFIAWHGCVYTFIRGCCHHWPIRVRIYWGFLRGMSKRIKTILSRDAIQWNGVFTWKLTVASLDSPRPEMKTNSFTNIWSSWPHSHYLCQDEWTMTWVFWPGPDCVSTLPVLFTLFWGGGGVIF